MNQRHLSRLRVFLILTLTFGAFVPFVSASPRDELLRLVPDDMMFCIVLQDLREHAKRLDKDDSFLAALRQMPFARAWIDSPEFKKLLDFQQHILKVLNLTAEQLRDDLLGDAVVFAYRQGKADRPDQEQALLLLRARDAKLLGDVVDRINVLQRKSGELKELRTAKHGKREYVERVKIKNGMPAENEYYFVRDNLLVFSQRDGLLKEVIDRDAAAAPVATGLPFWLGMTRKLGIEKSLIAFMLNPRAFDNELAKSESAAAGSEKAFLKEFRNYWKAFDGVGAFAGIGADLELGIAIHARKRDLPPAGQKLLAALGQPSDLWNSIPEDCLLALGARVDCSLLFEMVCGFLEPDRARETRKWLENTLQLFLPDNGNLDSLLKGLGPNWGLWIVPPTGDAKTWAPQAILAVSIPNTPEGAVAETTARSAVQFLLTAAQLSKEEFKVETIKIDKTTIKSLSHPTHFPPGFRPSFAVKDGYLLFASSPEAIGRFEKPKDSVSGSGETPLLRLSAKAWKAYLSQHKTAIAAFVEKTSGAPAKETTGLLEQITANLEPFDRLEIGVRADKDRATLMLRVRTVKGK